ncbi:MAG: tRNA epoxyqueuosine(34) reductase QueG [Bryobacterales bacterium]|nr:tRNA epoxyqueuosine(34) reductase QueG [Bryobacterales bacterium]
MDSADIRRWAAELGFALAGVARAVSVPETAWYQRWVEAGFAGEMKYLTDHRAAIRSDPRRLLPSAQTIVCLGILYNTPAPLTLQDGAYRGWISRYAWGDDYHDLIRARLSQLAERMRAAYGDFDYRVCVDTAPLLERSYARLAGLGWIGKNTCLINQGQGSWFLLGEILTSLEIQPDTPPPDRCGTCQRCVYSCPTQAIVPRGDGYWTIDSRRCISYLTIELRNEIPPARRPAMGTHLFGCDICQDVCPWNRRAPDSAEPAFAPREGLLGPDLEEMARLTPQEFRVRFGGTPVERARYRGFLRNVAIAMGNARQEKFRPLLVPMAQSEDAVVAEAAHWALAQLDAVRYLDQEETNG